MGEMKTALIACLEKEPLFVVYLIKLAKAHPHLTGRIFSILEQLSSFPAEKVLPEALIKNIKDKVRSITSD